MKKKFTLLLLFLTISTFVFGQNFTLKEAKQPLGVCETIIDQGEWSTNLETEEQVLQIFRNYIRRTYPNREIIVRDFQYRNRYKYYDNINTYVYWHKYTFAEVTSKKCTIETNLNKAFNKALMNIREGSRFSIDQVTVIGNITSEINKTTLKDNAIDILLDRGYKIVAKEYLETLYQEQIKQQSGIYNDNTTVQGNNFSAVGYYLNIKVTDESLRVQVINVSTGEYEGNSIVEF